MRNPITNWIDERTGLVEAWRRLLDSPVPGGPRLWNSLGFAFLCILIVEAATGILLSLTYSPGAGSAWGSVYYITHQMPGGRLIRGVHRFGSYAAVVLGGLWLLRLVLGGLYRAPREVRWWLALASFFLVLGLGATGNILPWDQRGFWAAIVETTIAGGTPVVGPALRRLVVGGSELGNQTLTRVHALHVLILPGLLLMVGWLQARTMGRSRGESKAIEGAKLWPAQAFYHATAAFLAIWIVLALASANPGYSLDAPADPSSDDYPARPEWYFLSLNQLLKIFQGREFIATLVIPGAVVSGLLALPLLDRILPRRVAPGLASGFLIAVGLGLGGLTAMALLKDSHSETYRAARVKADSEADRAVLLAKHDGIPPEGAAYLLKLDPLHRGTALFHQKCAGCHALGGDKRPEQWAPSLEGYGTYSWIRGLLEDPQSSRFFGKAPMCGGMAEWKEGSKLGAKELDDVASFVASFAAIPPDVTPEEWLEDPKVQEHPGRKPYQNECAECHTMGDPRQKAKMLQPAPDLFAWGSDRWTARMIKAPSHPSAYGYLEDEQKMPAFGDQLTDVDLGTLTRYLRGDWYRPTTAAPGGTSSTLHR